MERIMQRFFTMDYFSIAPSFGFKGKGEHSTRIGFLATCVMGIIGMYLTYEFGRDIWERAYPNVNQTTNYIQMPPQINFNGSIPLAFGIQNYSGWKHYINESIYVPYIHYYRAEKTINPETGKYFTNITQTIVKAEQCKLQYWKREDISEFVNQLELDSLYCLPYDGSMPLVASGNYDISLSESIVIQIKHCEDQIQYETSNLNNEEELLLKPQCVPLSDLETILKQAYFVIYFPDYQLDESNQLQPFKPFGRSIYTTISMHLQKEIDSAFRPIYIESDKGLFFESMQRNMIYSMPLWREMYVNTGSTLLWLQINADQYEDIYTFQYMKLQDVIATVGGTMQMLIFIIFVMVMPFVQINYQKEFVNNYFEKILEQQLIIKDFPIQLDTQNNIDNVNNNTNQPDDSMNVNLIMERKRTEENGFNREQSNLNEIQDSKINEISQNEYDDKEQQNNEIPNSLRLYKHVQNLENNYQLGQRNQTFQDIKNIYPEQQQNEDEKQNENEKKKQININQFDEEGNQEYTDEKANKSFKNPNYSIPYNRFKSRLNQINYSINTNHSSIAINNEDGFNSIVLNKPNLQQTVSKFTDESTYDHSSQISKQRPIDQQKILVLQDQIAEISKNPQEIINLGYFDYFRILFPCLRNSQTEKYKLSEEFIQKQLDVLNLTKRISELENLTRILLDPGQHCLFRFLEKPSIQQKPQIMITSIDQQPNELMILQEAFWKYQEIINQKEIDRSNSEKKIIEMISPFYQQLFDEQIQLNINNDQSLLQQTNTPTQQLVPELLTVYEEKIQPIIRLKNIDQENQDAQQGTRSVKQDVLSTTQDNRYTSPHQNQKSLDFYQGQKLKLLSSQAKVQTKQEKKNDLYINDVATNLEFVSNGSLDKQQNKDFNCSSDPTSTSVPQAKIQRLFTVEIDT